MSETAPQPQSAAYDVEAVREDFPVLERLVNGHPLCYLDNAATSQRPMAVIDALLRSYTHSNANIHRAIHTLGYEATVAYEDAHKKVARFVNAKSWREIVFVRNATEALNLAAASWGGANLRAGDEVALTLMEHHSNIVPWQMAAARCGATVRFLPVTADGVLDLDAAAKAINPRTRLVGAVHASNVLGAVNPVAELREMARKVGALFLLDGAQSVPHMPVDVRALDCDFLAASGHKMCGPTGAGFLYAKREHLEAMPPFLTGGDMIETVTTEGATWNELPWKFEAGTAAIAEGTALGAACDYLTGLGMDRIFGHEMELHGYVLEKLRAFPGLTLYGHRKGESLAVFSFNVDGVHPHDGANLLDRLGIAVRSGHHCAQPLMTAMGMDNTLRASFYLYNTKAEADHLLFGLNELVRIFRR